MDTANHNSKALRDAHWVATSVVGMVWIYHGLVPKLLGPHPQELAMLTAAGLDTSSATYLSYSVGILEILWGILVVIFRQYVWPFYLTIVAMVVLTILSIVVQPSLALYAFNPVTVNIAIIALCCIAIKLLHVAKGRSTQLT